MLPCLYAGLHSLRLNQRIINAARAMIQLDMGDGYARCAIVHRPPVARCIAFHPPRFYTEREPATATDTEQREERRMKRKMLHNEGSVYADGVWLARAQCTILDEGERIALRICDGERDLFDPPIPANEFMLELSGGRCFLFRLVEGNPVIGAYVVSIAESFRIDVDRSLRRPLPVRS